MKTYQAEYYDKTGKMISRVSFEANNQKEAWAMAQRYKKETPEILQAGRVRTSIGCISGLLKKLEDAISEADELQKEYKELRAKGQISKIDFLET